MRSILISALLVSLLAGCSSVNIGPHRIDVQQGNALDQETVARLKPGLSRSQVRFLLGTPLVVDPFRTDRWDYVYLYYKSGKLTEQKHLTLFFEGDVLARIAGDVPAPAMSVPVPVPVASPARTSQPAPVAALSGAETRSLPESQPPQREPLAHASSRSVVTTQAVAPRASTPVAQSTAAVTPDARQSGAPDIASRPPSPATSSIVAPLPSPKNVPPYVDPRTPSVTRLQAETEVSQIQPESPRAVIPAAQPVLNALNAWADAWGRRDEAAYFAAYDADFVPEGGGTRAAWEKRRQMLLDVAKQVDVRIESPVVDFVDATTATVTFKQFYRSDSYRDAVVKQLRMIERQGRWLIAGEKVLSQMPGSAK